MINIEEKHGSCDGVDATDVLLKPSCHQLYNLFYASQPSAMRVEPLIHDKFKHIPPISLPRYQKFPFGDGLPIFTGTCTILSFSFSCALVGFCPLLIIFFVMFLFNVRLNIKEYSDNSKVWEEGYSISLMYLALSCLRPTTLSKQSVSVWWLENLLTKSRLQQLKR